MDSQTTESQSCPVSSDEQSAVTSPFPSHGQITNPSLYMDTTLTKVFVGGLAWQTKSSVLHEHFAQYGDILEAVVIMDRNTGRSKGFGFVTFAEKEAAERATQNPNPVIDNRKANCNLAFLGATKRPTAPGRRDYPPQYTMPTTIPMQMSMHPYGYGYATHPTSGAETAHSVEGSEPNPTINGAGVVMMNPTSPYYSTYSSPYPQQTYSPYTVYQGGDYNPVYYGFSPQLYMSPSSVSSRPSYSPEQVPGPQYVYTSPPPYSTDMYASNGVPHMSTPQQHSINHNSNNNSTNSGSVVYASAPSSVVGPPPLILPQSHPNAVPITGVADSTRSDASAPGVVNANPHPDASPALSSSSSASSAITTTTGASPTNSTTSDAPQQTPSGTPPQQQQQQQQQSIEKTVPTNGHVMSSTGAPQQQQSQGLRGTSPVSPPHGYTAPSLPYGYTITTGTAVLMPFPQPGAPLALPTTVPATAHGHSTHMPQHAFYNPHHRSPPHVYQHRGGLRSTPSVQQTSSSHHPRGPVNNNNNNNNSNSNMNGKPMYYSAPVSNSTQDALSQQFQQLSVAPKSE